MHKPNRGRVANLRCGCDRRWCVDVIEVLYIIDPVWWWDPHHSVGGWLIGGGWWGHCGDCGAVGLTYIFSSIHVFSNDRF